MTLFGYSLRFWYHVVWLNHGRTISMEYSRTNNIERLGALNELREYIKNTPACEYLPNGAVVIINWKFLRLSWEKDGPQ